MADKAKHDAASRKALYVTLSTSWMASLCMGTALGYSSTALESLRVHAGFSEDDTFWFGSMLNLGAVLGCPAASALAQKVGRRRTLLVCAVGFAFAWICLFMAAGTTMLYVGRFLTGFFTGIVSLCVPIYITEVVTADSRGRLGGCLQLAITVGILYSYVMGRLQDWSYLALSCTVPPVILASLCLFSVESPRWLFLHDQKKAATVALVRRRSSDDDVDGECNAIETTFAKAPTPTSHVLLALHVMFLQQFSGINMIIFYASKTYADAGLLLNAADLAILVGVLQVAATAVAVAVMDVYGRRRLLLVSAFTCTSCMLVMGVLHSLTTRSTTDSPSVAERLPALLMALFVAGYSLGLGPVTWLLAAELVPLRGRGVLIGVTCTFNWMCAYAVTLFFESVHGVLSFSGLGWFFSTVSFVGSLMVAFFLPETGRLTLEQILLDVIADDGRSIAVERVKQ